MTDATPMKGKYVGAIGRRKSSIAQARVFLGGTGTITVNDLPMKSYFTTLMRQQKVLGPLEKAGMAQTTDVSVRVYGGGETGQADATCLAIARALVLVDAALRASLKSEGFLSRDARIKERKKPGLRKARRAPQWSKR